MVKMPLQNSFVLYIENCMGVRESCLTFFTLGRYLQAVRSSEITTARIPEAGQPFPQQANPARGPSYVIVTYTCDLSADISLDRFQLFLE